MFRDPTATRAGAPPPEAGLAAPGRPARASTRAMATEVTIQLAAGSVSQAVTGEPHPLGVGLESALESALQVFHDVESACTRFGTTSDLVRMNRAPGRWHRVPRVLFDVLVEAHRGYAATGGAFDPRVVRSLRALGYDRSLRFSAGEVVVEGGSPLGPCPRGAWRPRFRYATSEVHLRGEPVDLGGIGKGLAVRWAVTRLVASLSAASYLVEAGGDCYAAGPGPDDGLGWRIAVEDPQGGEEPVAVVRVVDRAVTTSSVRLRRWTAGGLPVHHIIDPRTAKPGGAGLLSVTTLGVDPAVGEVWSKALFLAGRAGIASLARRRGLAALWVDEGGEIGTTEAMDRHVMWRRG